MNEMLDKANQLNQKIKPVPDRFEVEVFKTGAYGEKGTYTIEDLDQLAASYDPVLSEAPITIDHQSNGPSLGWVSSLRRSGQKLVAQLKSVSPKLRDLISNGSYKKRSIELYRNFQGSGKPYLKALSFLGAASPEVKGLEDPIFSDAESFVIHFDDKKPIETIEESKTETFSAETYRDRLINQQVWNPKWEAVGFSEFLESLSTNEQRDKFVEFLECQQPLSIFENKSAKQPSPLNETIQFHGEYTDESLQNHLKALEFQSQDPTISYVDALIRASSESTN